MTATALTSGSIEISLAEIEKEWEHAFSKLRDDYLKLYQENLALRAAARRGLARDDLIVSVREFIGDWRKGDFELPSLAACDARDMEEKLAALSAEPVKEKP